MDLIKGQLTSSVLESLTNQLGGGASSQQTSGAADSIMEVLLGGVARNAASPDGANALNNALENDHDGGILDNLQDILGGKQQAPNPRAMNGAGILKHILGDKQSSIIDAISQQNGLNSSQTGSLMMKLAPVLLGVLGKQKRSQGLDASAISDLLSGERQQQQQRQSSSPIGGMLKSFIDQDGDGNIMDDLGGMLGRFLKK